jgi:hypothetical protein
MTYPRTHHQTTRFKLVTAKSVLVCVFIICLLIVAVCNLPEVAK